jgi:hypothetical protein
MRTAQKLEIGFGITTFVTASLYFVIFVVPLLLATGMSEKPDRLRGSDLVVSAIFFVLPEFLIAVGAYTHAAKRSMVGFILLLVLGIILIGFYGWSWVTGAAFYSEKNEIIVYFFLSPSLFAALTIVFAVRSLDTSMFFWNRKE